MKYLAASDSIKSSAVIYISLTGTHTIKPFAWQHQRRPWMTYSEIVRAAGQTAEIFDNLLIPAVRP